MITFKDYLIAEAEYSDMQVKTDKKLSDDAKKIKIKKKYSDIQVKNDKELAADAKKIKTK